MHWKQEKNDIAEKKTEEREIIEEILNVRRV
jgi:hypothetical protein